MFQIERKSSKQEHIPVVCVLPALVAILGEGAWGCLPGGGVSA